MTKENRTRITWIIRGVLAFMFLLSAVAKLYPSPNFALTTFEVKQLYPMGFSPSAAAYFSRILIGCEFALGIGLIQPHFLKKLVFPLSFLILLVFSIELVYEIASAGNSGNCGCFGSLLPMTPLQAVIKNVIGMGMIVALYRLMKDYRDKLNFPVISTIAFGCILGVFLVGPMTKITSDEVVMEETVVEEPVVVEDVKIKKDTIEVVASANDVKTSKAAETNPDKAEPVKAAVAEAPKPKKSGYASIFPDIDQDRKILCFFAPGCEHCQQTVKELTQLKKTIPNFPEIRIAFMDEETELIPEFFEIAGQKYTYKILDIASFWTKLGTGKDTPGVYYYWNGNLIQEYDGINEHKFDKEAFRKIVQMKWTEHK